jgi:hypothetical protein
MMRPFYINCDHVLEFDKVKNKITNEYVNDGTCTFAIHKKSDSTLLVSGSAVYVVSSQGKDRVTIDKTYSADVVEDEEYKVTVVFSDPDGDDWQGVMDLYGAQAR